MTKKNSIAESTLKRISDYLCVLRYLYNSGLETISSSELAEMMNLSDSQIRKDLSYFGSFGKRGVGYKIESFIDAIEKILNLKNQHRVCIIGIGRLGGALLRYKRFKETSFNIVAAFDKNKQKIGKTINNTKIYDINNFKKIVEQSKCEIVLITTPAYVVNDIYSRIINSDIKAILNFTPIILTGNDKILVRNLDFVSELKIISYLLKERDDNKGK